MHVLSGCRFITIMIAWFLYYGIGTLKNFEGIDTVLDKGTGVLYET